MALCGFLAAGRSHQPLLGAGFGRVALPASFAHISARPAPAAGRLNEGGLLAVCYIVLGYFGMLD